MRIFAYSLLVLSFSSCDVQNPTTVDDFFPVTSELTWTFDYEGSRDSEYGPTYRDRGHLTLRLDGPVACPVAEECYFLSVTFDGERSSLMIHPDGYDYYGPYEPLNWTEPSSLYFDGEQIRVDFDGKPNASGTNCTGSDCHITAPRFAALASPDTLTFTGNSGICEYTLELARGIGPTSYREGCYVGFGGGSYRGYVLTRVN